MHGELTKRGCLSLSGGKEWLVVRASLVYDPVTLLKRGEIESEAVIKMQRETHQNKCNGHREN